MKIVAVTASVLEEHREEILTCGCDDLIHKPFQYHEILEAMARQLDIKYVYKGGVDKSVRKPGIDLSAEMLAELPPELFKKLSEAILSLDREAILLIIEQIDDSAPDTAAGLREVVHNFQTARIRELIQDANIK